ncbi:TPA: hypothetical protein VAM23_001960 [Acinetobacter baumannii]|nr:hypothetical protein [Acinetobacter baumannii]
MDNYKIKVKDEAGSKEAQELFVQLGYSNRQSKRFGFVYTQNGEIGCDSMEHWAYYNDLCKELTLPQLRDLVVLKRNNVNDANYRSKSVLDGFYFKSCDGFFYFMFEGKWVRSTTNTDEGLEPITQPQDPALISGDVALANVHKCTVQYLHDDEPYGRWTTITDHLWSQYHLGMFLDPDTKFKFRFKPQTIKLELELPKPFEPEEDCHVYILDDGKTDGYRRYSYEVHGDKGNTFIGIWRTEDEIKQVVEQLRKIRGTNS